MAAQPQHTLATANAPTTHGALLSGSPSSTTAPSPRLAHYTSGRLSSSSSVLGVGGGVGSNGCGSGGGGDRCGFGRGICGSTRSLVSNTSSTSTTPHNHYQTPRPASRRVRPCSLCGTTAYRPQPSFLNSSPVGPLEQPIVLLHRLEDGLPQGDVKSLHAYGTIRLLPVQPPQDHDASDCEGESDTSVSGKGGRVKQAMDHVPDGHTGKEKKREKNCPWRGDNRSHDDSEEGKGERYHIKNHEVEMKSILFEDSCSLEDIIESEVSVNPANGDHGCVQIYRPSVIKHSLHKSDNESDHESFHEELIGEVVLENEQTDSDSDRDIVNNNASNQRSQNTVSKCQDSISKNGKIDKTLNSEKESSALSPCSSPVSDRNHSSDYTPGSPSKHASLSSVVTPVSSTETVSQASLSSSCPTTHSTCTQPPLTSQPLVSHSPTMLHDRHDSITKSKCHRSSPSLPDHLVVYSPTARQSPMSLSPSTGSSHLPVPSPPISVPSPSLVESPPSSPPSPCESSSLLFSPPPSPSPDVTDLDCSRLEEKDLQTQPSSPYSPGSSPASPASLVSQNDSPPSPSVSAELPHNSPNPLFPTIDEQSDSSKVGSDLDVVSHHSLTDCNTAVVLQHPLTPSHDSQVDSSIKTQVECSVDINDTSAHTQVELRGSSDCNGLLRHGDSMAYDDSEKKTKPSLDNCASSIVEHVNVEPDTTPMKIRFRIRPKTSKPPAQKHKKDEHSKNGIPKIVLTLKGDGPNKEYSCSNRIRNEDQSISDINTTSRKHKSKRDKKEKEKYKVKKSLKGNRYKRHLELFGEDSNDAIELRKNYNKGLNGKGEDVLRVPDSIQDCAKSPLAFPKLGESPECSDDDLFLPVKEQSYNFSESINKVCEKVRRSSPDQGDVLDGSFSDSLPDLEPVLDPEDEGKPGSLTKLLEMRKEEDSQIRLPKATRIKKRVKLHKKKPTRGMLAKKKILKSLNHKKVLPIRRRPRRIGFGLSKEGQSSPKSETSSKTENTIEDQDFNDEQRNSSSKGELEENVVKCEQNFDTEIEIKKENCLDLMSSTSTSESIENMQGKNDSVPSQDTAEVSEKVLKTEKPASGKNTSSYLRTRRDRNCKLPDSVTDFNKCLWVSFGVDAPIRVLASEVPSLMADTKVREKNVKSRKNNEEFISQNDLAKRNEPKSNTSVSSQNSDKKSSGSTGNSVSCKKTIDEKANVKLNSVDHLVEETAKQLVKEYNDKKERSSENVIILPNKEAENWKPIKPRTNAKVLGEQAERGPVEGHAGKPNKTLNNSPKRSLKSVDEGSHDRRPSSEVRKEEEEKTNLNNCVNSSSTGVEASSEVNSNREVRKNNSRDTSIIDECTKISAADLMKDDQYYRPKKIQKVLNENLMNLTKFQRSNSVTAPNMLPSSDLSIEERKSDLNKCESVNKTSDTVKEATEALCADHVRDTFRKASDKSKAESEISESCTNNETVNEAHTEKDVEVRNTDVEGPSPVPPHDPEFEKVWGVRFRRRGRRRKQTTKLSSQEKSSVSLPDKQQEVQSQAESASNTGATSPARDNVQLKRDKEVKKTIRRTRKKDEIGSDSESSTHSEGSGKASAYKEIQQRIEVQHEEERGRRLAQEIKGFNWLEQKIKNSSLNPPTKSAASSTSASKKLPVLLPKTLSRTLSLPATSLTTTSLIHSNSQPVPSKRDESDFRRNSFTGSTPSSGLRGHLQTAVPPLLQSSRVTALPKRRSSPPNHLQSPIAGGVVTASTAVPSSSPSALHGSININPTMGVVYGPVQSSGPATYSIADVSAASLYNSSECDRATLYSSTDSNKATLYGVPNPQLEVLFENAQATAGILYGDATSAQSTTVSGFPVTGQHPSSDMSSRPFSLTTLPASVTRHEDWKDPKKGNSEAVVSSSTSSPKVSSAAVSLNDNGEKASVAATAETFETNVVTSVSTNMAVSTTVTDVTATSTVNLNTEGSSSVQHSQVSTGPAIGVRFSHKQALLKRAFSDMLKFESNALPVTTQEVKNPADKSTKLQDAPSQDDCSLIIDVDTQSKLPGSANKNSSESNDDKCLLESTSNNVSLESLDTGNGKSSTAESKSSPEENETQDKEGKDKLKGSASPDAVKEKLLKCMSLKNEEKSSVDIKDKYDVGGMDSAQLGLFSMLYEELKRTREEVERLRKRQELLLTEKCEKKDDEREEKEEKPAVIEEKSESPKITSILKNEDQSSNSAEKTARISIRNDLIASENAVTPSSHVSSSSIPSSVITSVECAMNAKAPAVTEKPVLSPLPKTSPSIPQTSPASCRASPRSTRASPLSQTSPVHNPLVGSPAMAQPDVAIIHTSLGPPLTSPTASQKCTVSSPYSTPPVSSHGIHNAPRASPVLPRSSPVITRNSPGVSGSPGIPKTSPGLKSTSPAAQSPGAPKDKNLIEMMPSKLRTAFGINKEVEVMAVTVGSRPPLTEPPPQTFLQVLGDQHSMQDTQLPLEAVRSRAQEIINGSEKERNSLHSSVPLSQRSPHEAMKRSLSALSSESDMKRPRMSTSDLPEFPPSSRKPPPPLKPVASVQRRYSDGSDSRKMEPIMVHLPHSNIHALTSSPNEPNSAASLYAYGHPRTSPNQHQPVRRSNESALERNMEYQQALGVQHAQFQQHIGSSPPVMRSLGPDKATIIPIPAPPKPSGIHPYVKPFVPPTSRGSAMDQHPTGRLEQPVPAQDNSRASWAYFQKMKQNAQQTYDAALSAAAERGVGVGKEGLQVSPGPFEKTIQPQTFAPRVLVRESVPETSLQMPPPPPFSNAQHFPDCNPRVPNVVPSHHFLNNLHHGANPGIHHMVTSGLLLSGLQGSSTTLTTAKSNPRSSGGSSSEKKQCLLCPQQARFLCSGCKKAWYCSENCQRSHWAVHNTSCVP